MRITLAFVEEDPGYAPDLISAYTDAQLDDWNGVPDWHLLDVRKYADRKVRELVIDVPDEAVFSLFRPPPPLKVEVVDP